MMVQIDNRYLLYVLLIYIVCFYNFLNLKNKKLKLLFAILPMGIILAFQVNIGTDYYSYVKIYLGESSLPYSRGIIFRYILDILNIYFKSPRALFVLSAMIQSILIYNIIVKLYRLNVVKYISLLIFILITATNWYLMMFNGIRNSIASLFIVLSIVLLLENRILKSFLIFLLGIGFHPSVIICFPIYFFKNSLLKKKNIKLICFIIIGFYCLNNFQIIPKLSKFIYNLNLEFKYRHYLVSKYMFPYRKTYGFGTMAQIIFYLMSFSFYKEESKKEVIFLYNLGYFAFACTLLFNNIPIFSRLLGSFVLFQSYVIYILVNRTLNKNYMYIGIYIYFFYVLYFIRNVLLIG